MGFLPSLVDKVVEEKGTLCVKFILFCLVRKGEALMGVKNGMYFTKETKVKEP